MPAKVDHKKVDQKLGRIYVGIGGWNFEPWRGVFYPKGLPQSKELEYAASHLTSIEINATFYGSQKPESFRKWAATVPDGFVFSVKGPRFATNRRVLAEAGELDQTFSRYRRARARRSARAAALAIRSDQKTRSGRFRKIPGVAAGESRQHGAAARCGSPTSELLRTRLRRACAQLSYPDRVHRSCALSVARRRDRRFHLRAAAKRPRHDTDSLSAQGAGRLDQALAALGGRKIARRLAAHRRCKRTEDSGAARRLCLCHSRRKDTCTPCCNGVNRQVTSQKIANVSGTSAYFGTISEPSVRSLS